MESIEKLAQKLSLVRHPVLVIHTHPDGDAIGSALALAGVLSRMGKDVKVISPDPIPDYLEWLPGLDAVIDYSAQPGQAFEAIRRADLILLVDHNTTRRAGEELGNELEKYLASKDFALIDHHLQPDPRIPLQVSDPGLASTAELVFQLLDQTGWWDRYAGPDTATQIYTGIMTDTGSFKFPKTVARTHEIIARLIRKGASNSDIHSRVYDTYTFDKIQLLAYALQNMRLIPECASSYMALGRDVLEKFHYRPGYTEGIVNYGLNIRGINFTVLLTQVPGTDNIKLSFRSKGNFDVNRFARKYFDGGGHKNAAGGRSNLTMEQTVAKLEEAIRAHCNEIKQAYDAS